MGETPTPVLRVLTKPIQGQAMDIRRVTRILIVDDHPVMREGLEGLLAQQPDMQVCGQAENTARALQEIERAKPDTIVLDLTLGAEDGVDLVVKLRKDHPQIRILILSMHDELLYAERLLSMGVQGYIMKQEASSEFLRALRKVSAGDVYVSQAVNARLLEQISRSRPRAGSVSGMDTLTAREREVLSLTGRGSTTREISQALSMSEKTVDSHRRNIREKLGLHTSSELLRYAFRWVGESHEGENVGVGASTAQIAAEHH
jgi:DNA-binding NarL/FixJ family response regulator